MIKLEYIKQGIKIGVLLIITFSVGTTFAVAANKITAEQARSIAVDAVDLKEVGNISDVELEFDGVLVYAVEFTKDGVETDVKINAQTGEIVKIESDKTEVLEEGEDK